MLYEYQNKGYIERVRRDLYTVISLETKQPIGELPAGAKLLWVCGDRGFHTVGGTFGGHLKCRGRIRFIPAEDVLGASDSRYIEGLDLDSPSPSENEYMKRYSAANYAHRVRAGLAR